MVTMPSARFLVAVVGQTSMHGGSSQCWQPTGTNARWTSGYSPCSMSSTRRHCTPGGVAFACRHDAVHVWQPTQRRRSATIAQRVIVHVAPRLPCDADPHDVRAGARRVGEVERHRRERIHARHAEVLGERRRPVVELADQEQRVGADPLAQHGAAAHLALRRRDLDLLAVADAEPRRRLRVDDHAAVALDVVGDFLDELHADVRAPRVLHAARGEQPERIVLRLAAGLLERGDPRRAEVLALRQRLVLRQLLVPPVHVVLVQTAPELGADAQQPLLVRQLEAQTLLDERRVQVPLDARERLRREARVLPPVESVRLAAVGQLGARGAADGVPDRLRRVRDVGRERRRPSAGP